jgi:hypothetical protein
MTAPGSRFDEERDGYLYGLMRLLLGVLLVVQSFTLLGEARRNGYFGNFFHLPLLPEALVPGESTYYALLALEFGGGLLAVAGYRGRAGLCVAALTGIYLLLCDRLQYHNNRFALFLFAGLVSLTPCDRSFLLYRGRRHTLDESARRGPIWARRLIQFQVSAIYLASSLGKLFDPDWRSGQTLLPRFRTGLELLETELSPPAFVRELMTEAWFADLAAKAAITTELFLAFGLVWGRTRVLALWVGLVFHLGIELTSRIELFSWLMGVSYLAFVTPEIRFREFRFDPSSRSGSSLARWLPWLDWLARFKKTELDAPLPIGFLVVDRGRASSSGLDRAAALARCLPLLFLAWPLFELLRAVRRRSRFAPSFQ